MRYTGRSTKLPFMQAMGWFSAAGVALRALCARFALASARYRQRRHLEELDDHRLADIGLTQRDVKRECAKPFWES